MHCYDGRFGKSGRFCFKRPTRLFYHESLHILINIINTYLHFNIGSLYTSRSNLSRQSGYSNSYHPKAALLWAEEDVDMISTDNEILGIVFAIFAIFFD